MRIVLHRAESDHVWSLSADGTTVIFQSLDGPADLLHQLADLLDEAQPVSEREWEQARQRLMT